MIEMRHIEEQKAYLSGYHQWNNYSLVEAETAVGPVTAKDGVGTTTVPAGTDKTGDSVAVVVPPAPTEGFFGSEEGGRVDTT